MEKIKSRIKKEYFNGIDFDLTDDEVLDFVNKVWRKFLEDGSLLTMPLSPITDIDSLPDVLKRKTNGYRIITKDGIKSIPAGETGLIVSIDWTQSKEAYMPDELINIKTIEAKPEIQGVYSVNNGEGVLSSSYENAKTLAEVLDIPFKSFDKHDYIPGYEISEKDYLSLVQDVISDYIIRKYHTLDLDLRDRLVTTYQNDIIVAFKLLKKDCAFNDQIFMNKIIKFIEEQENVKA